MLCIFIGLNIPGEMSEGRVTLGGNLIRKRKKKTLAGNYLISHQMKMKMKMFIFQDETHLFRLAR